MRFSSYWRNNVLSSCAQDWLDKSRILENLSDFARTQITALDLFFTLPSTNTYLLSSTTSGHVCLAEHQSAGRGRRGKTWVSPLGGNIYLSLRWHFVKAVQELSGLSLVVGLAVAKTLEEYGVPALSLKWPNDVLVNNQKIAGVLVELAGKEGAVVIGIGINGRLSPSHGAGITQPWTDIATHCQQPVQRNVLLALLLETLLTHIARFETFGFSHFQDQWKNWDTLAGKAITLTLADGCFVHGIAQGVDSQGALLVKTPSGQRVYHGGEVSVRRAINKQHKILK